MNPVGRVEVEMDPSRWEQGSDFHLPLQTGVLEAPWSGRPCTFWGSGRDAMRALLSWGRDAQGWERLLVPTFFCQNVVAALAKELEVAVYPDAPGEPLPELVEAGGRDVLLVVNTYGMRGRAHVQTRAVLLEDHTHDPLSPWAFESAADYAVASLRKTLPLPDGGVLWSPRGRALPAERGATDAHLRAAFDRLSGMLLKRHYLEGHPVRKEAFRARAVAGEEAIGGGEISGMTPLSRARVPGLPGRTWREARARNRAAFRAALGEVAGVGLLEAPFAATLVFDSPAHRERVKVALLEARIYPAVFWPLEAPVVPGIPKHHLELSRRVLSLHCDFRYDERDMGRVAEAVRAAAAA